MDTTTFTDLEVPLSIYCPDSILESPEEGHDLLMVSQKAKLNTLSYKSDFHQADSCSHENMVRGMVCLPVVTERNCEEIRLLHHYVSHVSTLMVPVDSNGNPWKSTYLAIGSQKTSSAARALYAATLAQAALHLAHLRGPAGGSRERTHALRYTGLAIGELRSSLSLQTDDYTTVMAALVTLISTQHVFQNNSHGWRDHYRGALAFVSQHLNTRPWLKSWDAWIVTQSLVLGIIFAGTARHSTWVISNGSNQVHDLLTEVMIEPQFGCTVGGTARHLGAIHKIRMLEEEIAVREGASGVQYMSPKIFEQICQIIQQVQMLTEDKDESSPTQDRHYDMEITSQERSLVTLHSQIFDAAVMIHLCRVVLKCPPSAMASYVLQVLTSVITFIEMGGGHVSAWPMLIAAAEACTPEAQDLATKYFNHSEKSFAGNRRDIYRVARQVWADRDALASERQCSPGDIQLDWRDVMTRLDIDILLL